MDIKALTDEVKHISRVYASRFEINRDDTWFLLKLQEEVGELTQAHLMPTGQARTKVHDRRRDRRGVQVGGR